MLFLIFMARLFVTFRTNNIKSKIMKTLRILMLGAVVSFTSVSFAQEQGRKEVTPEMRAERMTKKMAVDLALTKDQIQKVHSLNLEAAKKQDAMRAEKEQSKEANKAFRTEMEAKYKTVLTPEQMTKMKELEKQRMETRQVKSATPATPAQNGQPAIKAQPVMRVQTAKQMKIEPQTIQTEKTKE
jgi:Spy/CpxP family protein refolding chaperone